MLQYPPLTEGNAKRKKPAAAMSGPIIRGAPRAITSDESTRPAGKKEYQQNQRQSGSAGRGRGVSLHLDEVQREQEKEDPQSRIEEQGEQVGTAETAGFKERRRNHGLRLIDYEAQG